MAAAGGSWKGGAFISDPVPYVDLRKVEFARFHNTVPTIPENIGSAEQPLIRFGGQQELYRNKGIWWVRYPGHVDPIWIRSDPMGNAQLTMGYASRHNA